MVDMWHLCNWWGWHKSEVRFGHHWNDWMTSSDVRILKRNKADTCWLWLTTTGFPNDLPKQTLTDMQLPQTKTSVQKLWIILCISHCCLQFNLKLFYSSYWADLQFEKSQLNMQIYFSNNVFFPIFNSKRKVRMARISHPSGWTRKRYPSFRHVHQHLREWNTNKPHLLPKLLADLYWVYMHNYGPLYAWFENILASIIQVDNPQGCENSAFRWFQNVFFF